MTAEELLAQMREKWREFAIATCREPSSRSGEVYATADWLDDQNIRRIVCEEKTELAALRALDEMLERQMSQTRHSPEGDGGGKVCRWRGRAAAKTSCGRTIMIRTDGRNGDFTYCPYCGGKVEEAES